MKYYDPNVRDGIHRVQITLQQWEYVGHIIYQMSGNCQGLSVLNTADFETDSYTSKYAENDCNLRFDEDAEIFSLELNGEDGDTLEIHADAREMNDMIVSIEILEVVDK